VRDGADGGWKYNPQALSTGWDALPADLEIDPATWVMREVPRFIHRVALTKFIRSNLSQKDWDAFIEIYGVPGGIVIGPPEVPAGKEREYAAAAESASQSGHAFLPHGSTYTANDGPRGTNPFAEHMRFLSEQLVLAGTGGKLTMLAESGSGTLAGGAHQETFERIARGEARKISEILQRQVVAPFLAERFPGQPELAYFEIAFREEVDAEQIVEDAVKLAQAGYRLEADELSEKTGYRLEGGGEKDEVKEEPKLANRLAAELGVPEGWVRPVERLLEQMQAKAETASPEEWQEFLVKARGALPELLGDMEPEALAGVLERAMTEAVEAATR
jgi:hypothetical protein